MRNPECLLKSEKWHPEERHSESILRVPAQGELSNLISRKMKLHHWCAVMEKAVRHLPHDVCVDAVKRGLSENCGTHECTGSKYRADVRPGEVEKR